ncbi:dienelactone hydrolase family protein [Neoroseomonas rubea]|uniref:dienelactone hydrolase family protein n=1 Tax=Neoroseomonas rubea TaxID=2748666 RepID=UPI0018DFBDE4|nr:hypothetical protein [Roseomonas rubea]
MPALARMLARALFAIAVLSAGRGLAADVGSVGLLWPPDEAAAPAPLAVVVALHDTTGIGPRGWHYGKQLTAAGIAVLFVELVDTSADGVASATASDDAAAARDRMAQVMDLLARDPRFAGTPVGFLAFGDSGLAALRAASDPAHGDRTAGLVLLYPGCATLASAARAEAMRPRSPILLLHGDADPVNLPADCRELAAELLRFVPVRRRQYAGAGYAWDYASYGSQETVKLPWPGRPGMLVPVSHWPQLTELTATQVAAFFAMRFSGAFSQAGGEPEAGFSLTRDGHVAVR